MRRALIAAIHWYQRHISAKTAPTCRFTPTCSQYAVGAIERFGAMRGSLLALWRILRCNPIGGHGYDPVPDRFTFKRTKIDLYMDDDEAESLYDPPEHEE